MFVYPRTAERPRQPAIMSRTSSAAWQAAECRRAQLRPGTADQADTAAQGHADLIADDDPGRIRRPVKASSASISFSTTALASSWLQSSGRVSRALLASSVIQSSTITGGRVTACNCSANCSATLTALRGFANRRDVTGGAR